MNNLALLDKIHDSRGNLTFIEEGYGIDFIIKRVYLLYDIPGGETRQGHAYMNSHEFIISLSGSFDVTIYHENKCEKHSLNQSNMGIKIPPLYWRELSNFSTNSLVMIVSSHYYDEKDYIRDFSEYLNSFKHV
jgi:WxcM-like, C-terminal